MSDELSPPRIVCAANRFPDGTVVASARHHDRVMNLAIIALDAKGKSEQGFIDQHGQWYNRQEAWHIAVANGQIVKTVGGNESKGGTLYSENLY